MAHWGTVTVKQKAIEEAPDVWGLTHRTSRTLWETSPVDHRCVCIGLAPSHTRGVDTLLNRGSLCLELLTFVRSGRIAAGKRPAALPH